jgi:hypothetical protein
MNRAAVFDGLLELLAARLAVHVLKELSGTAEGATYTSRKGGPHIPGKSRAWMLRHIKTMPGSRKVGRDWIIGKDDFDRWAAAHDTARRRSDPTRLAKASMDDVDWADACLAENGIRVPKREA